MMYPLPACRAHLARIAAHAAKDLSIRRQDASHPCFCDPLMVRKYRPVLCSGDTVSPADGDVTHML